MLAKQDVNDPRNDRLMLNEQSIKNIANSIRKISKLPNPSGKILRKEKLYNGLQLEKIRFLLVLLVLFMNQGQM